MALSFPHCKSLIRGADDMTGYLASTETTTAPVKLAYLIIAHHQPKHLARLIRVLDDQHSFFFIHIDKKSPLAPFKAALPERENLVFVQERIEVEWAKVSMVEATLNSMRAAVASGHAFKYYTLLSGSDYPIKHKRQIYARLQAGSHQFLRIDRKLTNDANNSHRNLINDLPGGKYFEDLTPYHGSMYWSLTAECIRYVLNFVDDNPGYLRVHHDMFAPDEVFFNTLIKQSPFAKAITHDYSDGVYPDHTLHANHFIDWASIRAGKRTTLELVESDFDDLLTSAALFARKFDEKRSRKLLKKLDEQVHNISP